MSQAEIPTAPASPKPIPTISIRASLARLAATCKATNDIRYYLHGMLVEPRKEGGAYIVATNGHMLIAIIDKDGTCSEPTIISPSKHLLAACPKVDGRMDSEHAVMRTMEIEGKAALAVTCETGMLQAIQPRDVIMDSAKFPEWRRVLPDFDAMEPGCPQSVFPPYRNAPFVALGTGMRRRQAVECWHDKARDMLVQRLNHMDHVVHVVMPQRDAEPKTGMVAMWRGAKA